MPEPTPDKSPSVVEQLQKLFVQDRQVEMLLEHLGVIATAAAAFGEACQEGAQLLRALRIWGLPILAGLLFGSDFAAELLASRLQATVTHTSAPEQPASADLPISAITRDP